MKNYITQKGKNKYTPFAGIKLISDLIDKLDIKEAIDSRFPLPNSNRGYSPYSYVKSIILGLLLGADCIMDIDNIKQDEVLKDIADVEIPHSTRIGSFLYLADTSKIDSVHRIMQDTCITVLPRVFSNCSIFSSFSLISSLYFLVIRRQALIKAKPLYLP